LAENTANIAFAGFTAPKILWVKNNEPENFKRIAKIMLPKDYINYLLTGVHCTDFSDAAGTLLLDVKNKRWSEKMLSVCGAHFLEKTAAERAAIFRSLVMLDGS
jgi:xylulokinase